MRRLADFYAKHAVAIDLALITMGAGAVKRQFEAVHDRLGALESGEAGMVPRDDVVSLREFTPVQTGVDRALGALVDAGLLPDPEVVIDVEVYDHEEAPGAVEEGPGASVGAVAPEAPQGDPEAL